MGLGSPVMGEGLIMGRSPVMGEGPIMGRSRVMGKAPINGSLVSRYPFPL